MPPTYYAIFTTVGLARLAEAQAAGDPAVFYELAVGDGNGSPITPSSGMTELVNETARVAVNLVTVSPDEPSTIRIEGLIPAETGGFTIREAGIFNADNELLIVASFPPIYKPEPSDGVTADEYIRILVDYEAVEAVQLSVDPAVVMATREYVDAITDQLDDRVTYLEGVALAYQLGDGSDGAADLDGINTYPWASLVGSTYTVTRAPYLTTLRVRSGIDLDCANFPLYHTGKITNDVGGVIHCDGIDATNQLGAAGRTGGMFLDSGAGGDSGGSSDPGDDGGSLLNSVGGSGGSGGLGDSVHNGGAGGVAGVPDEHLGTPRTLRALLEGYIFGNDSDVATITGLRGGAGGGGGGGGLTGGALGGGGGGAGIVAIIAREIENNGTIRANGGDGKNGSAAGAVGCGCGGGGGGGRVGIVTGSLTGSGTIEAVGGAHGVNNTTGATDGDDGEVIILLTVEKPEGQHVENGKAFFTAADEVTVTFPNSWAYAVAVGLDGYDVDLSAPYVEAFADYGGPILWITNKTLTGFTIKASDVFTGEVAWRTKGN